MLALATQHQYVVFFDQCVESASVTHVFMAHPEAVKLYRAYPYVVLLDSTYKTNRYGYPLVELNNTWMSHSTKFVKCYTNKVMHFGNTTTSRVESSHAALKLCLVNSTLALDTVWKRTHTLLEGQNVDIRNSLEQSCSVHIPSNHGRLFSSLAGHVATYAIILMHEEYDMGVVLGVGLNERCGCTIVTTHGLLCACKLHDLHRKGQRVHL
ncbi:hypothetical protein LINPERPRIM_LOCUS42663 [Linum perenne]